MLYNWIAKVLYFWEAEGSHAIGSAYYPGFPNLYDEK